MKRKQYVANFLCQKNLAWPLKTPTPYDILLSAPDIRPYIYTEFFVAGCGIPLSVWRRRIGLFNRNIAELFDFAQVGTQVLLI